MTDGQRFSELAAASTLTNDAALMLFGPGRHDVAAYAASLPAAHPPGTAWNYNSAGYVLVADALTRAVTDETGPGARRAAMLAWMKARLLDPIGMAQTQPEFDAEGTFVASSFVYASARDFARLGLLYLRDGVWDARRILPEGWVDLARTPSAIPDGDSYGAGWWVAPASGTGHAMFTFIDTGPERDAFRAEGHEGQILLVVPSRDLVIVRLGRSAGSAEAWRAIYGWIGDLARAFPGRPPPA
jgi:CubicO group peptidase (beta-lactamase class C family)